MRVFWMGKGGESDVRRIRRDLSGHSELDRLCFFMNGFELGKKISLAESRDGLQGLTYSSIVRPIVICLCVACDAVRSIG